MSFLEKDNFFDNIHDPAKWDVKCSVCKKLYKQKGTTYLWEEKYGAICRGCYIKKINENPSEEQIREWAGYSLNSPRLMIPTDCSYENFEKLVKPMIKKIREERAAEAERKHREELHERAERLYYECHHDPINIIARLLDEIDKVKDSIPERDLSQVRFN